MTDSNDSQDNKNDSTLSSGLFGYKAGEKQTVLKIFGIELIAPKGLKNPGIVYLSFIIVNFILFLVLRSFIA